MDMLAFLEQGDTAFLPHLSIDLVIIGYEKNCLKCLLLKLGDKWVLPGGYIHRNDSVSESVDRILKERTGLKTPHFEFLDVFGGENRSFGNDFKPIIEQLGLPWNENYWINKRFVTLAHYSLVNINQIRPSPSQYDEAIEWFPFSELPKLWLDHADILETARVRLKSDIKHGLPTYNLLPEPFTMPQLHQLHQTILEQPIDRSRFQKNMLATGLFERLPKLEQERPGRNPYQYRIKI